MRMTVATLTLLSSLLLAACGGPEIGSEYTVETLDTVCADQSAMAQAGRTDGRAISITCP